ncbi:MAG: VWA domain-containing protein [Pyrinomonadaceae bacterium]
MTAKDFQVFENGQPKPIAEVESSSAPFKLVLLLDVSGSVEELLDFIRKAARSFVTTASSQDRLAVISFRDDVQLVSDFTTNRRQLLEAVDQIDAGGSTALYDSLAYVLLHTLRPLRGARTAVVVLSDGDDNKSFLPFPSLLDVAVESGAVIYPLYVPSGLIRRGEAALLSPHRAAADVDPMRNKLLTLTTRAESEGRRLAEESGGVFYPIKRLGDLQQAYQDIMGQLRTSYGVTYLSDYQDARERRVRVRVDRTDAAVKLSPAVEAVSIKQ